MNREDFDLLIKSLEGFNYFFISGFAVHIFSSGLRHFKDIDIVISSKDIDLFAKRVGCEAKRRFISKGSFVVDDYGFECKIGNQEVEVTSGYPPNRVSNNTFNKLFTKKVKKNYLGNPVFLAPLEEIIAYKALTFRKKDEEDLLLLKSKKYSSAELKEIISDLEEEKITKNLKKVGYFLS